VENEKQIFFRPAAGGGKCSFANWVKARFLLPCRGESKNSSRIHGIRLGRFAAMLHSWLQPIAPQGGEDGLNGYGIAVWQKTNFK
jgi:hypothetical protein